MLRSFTDLVNETVNEAYDNGINLFLESLEADLSKDAYISEHGLEKVIGECFELTDTIENIDNDMTDDVTSVE